MYDKKAYMKAYREKNREKWYADNQKWRKEHPEKVSEYNHKQYLKRKARKAAERGETVPEVTAADNRIETVNMNIYDKEEIYPNCTVQVLTNTLTGETSVGWWINPE